MAEPILTPTEVAGRLGLTLTDEQTVQMAFLIDDVTESLALSLGNDFSTGTATETHTTRSSRVVLDRWPATTVTSVTDTDTTLDAVHIVDADNGVLRDLVAVEVEVVYDYGFATIPAVLKGIAAQMVGRAFGTPAHRSGHTSETTGPYSVQIGAAAAAGVTGMMRDERLLLEQLQRQIPRGSVFGVIELESGLGFGLPAPDPWVYW